MLIIEDHADLSRALAVRIEAAGLEVASAYDGVSGLEGVQRLDPAVIVLDINLPRMNGLKLLQRLRAQKMGRDIPVIVMTGGSDPAVEDKATRWGVSRVFKKPVDQRELAQAVIDLVDGR